MWAIEKIRAYMAQNVDIQRELQTNLEMAKVVEVATRKKAKKEASLLRKTELEKWSSLD